MSNLKRIVKDLAKKESATYKDPGQLGQYSATNQVAEDEVVGASGHLGRYLKSRGIDPRYVTRNKRIAASKTNDFKKWQQWHDEEKEPEDVEESKDSWSALAQQRAKKKWMRMNQRRRESELYHSMAAAHRSHKQESVEEDTQSHSLPSPTAKRASQLSSEKSKHNPIVTPGLRKEDNFEAPDSATQSVPNNTGSSMDSPAEQPSNLKREMSKSARIIKSIYKKQRVTEDMFDHEKEDKSVQTYGKKPKMQDGTGIKGDSDGNGKAKVVISGGTTLTGDKRDTIEVEPEMKRPNKNDGSVIKKQ